MLSTRVGILCIFRIMLAVFAFFRKKDPHLNFEGSGTKILNENTKELCLTDHSARYIVFNSVLVFLATPMCYIPF